MKKIRKSLISKGWCEHMMLSVSNEIKALDPNFDAVASKNESRQKRRERRVHDKNKTLKFREQRKVGRQRW